MLHTFATHFEAPHNMNEGISKQRCRNNIRHASPSVARVCGTFPGARSYFLNDRELRMVVSSKCLKVVEYQLRQLAFRKGTHSMPACINQRT
jgi:hypothetical protein